MPALGTGIGGLSTARFAAQFALALRHFEEATERGPPILEGTVERNAHRSWADVAAIQREVVQTWGL